MRAEPPTEMHPTDLAMLKKQLGSETPTPLSLDERDIAMSALHDIMEMEWGERKETPFQFEQRIHKVAHDAWHALTRSGGVPDARATPQDSGGGR